MYYWQITAYWIFRSASFLIGLAASAAVILNDRINSVPNFTFAAMTIEEWFSVIVVAFVGGGATSAVHHAKSPQIANKPVNTKAIGESAKTEARRISDELIAAIKWAEGYRDKVYKCSAGYNTIGYGYNIDVNAPHLLEHYRKEGITKEAAEALLMQEIGKAVDNCLSKWPWLMGVPQACRDSIFDMTYNMGFAGMCQWTNTMKLAEKGAWDRVANIVKKSKYASQVGRRARRIVAQFRTEISQPVGAMWNDPSYSGIGNVEANTTPEKPYLAYRMAGDVIGIRREADDGYYSTATTDVATARAFVDSEMKDVHSVDDVDWKAVY